MILIESAKGGERWFSTLGFWLDFREGM